MREMRRKDRLITDTENIREIISSCKVFRMAVQDEDGLYIVPLNFGYLYDGEELKLYFHSAKEGRKVDALAANPNVAVEMDTDHYLVEGEAACDYSYCYSSLVGSGTARLITLAEEKVQALDLLMRHQTERNTENRRKFDKSEEKQFSYTEAALNAVAVYEIRLTGFTCKARR